jgi:hypothetical protein
MKRNIMLSVVGALVLFELVGLATGNGKITGLLLMMALLGLLYFLPTVIALQANTSTTAAAVIINVFLGWTFIGWVVALALAASGKSRTGDLQHT